VVNVFLSSFIWTRPLNECGVRQHVAALYEEVFSDVERRVYPARPSRGLMRDVLDHLPALLKGELNVVCQDYPMITAGVATFLKRDPAVIVHTWKVPGSFEPRLAAKANDWMLRRTIGRARAVVVVSQLQAARVRALFPHTPVIIAPVSVDSVFWHPSPGDADQVLVRLGIKPGRFILTVGGPDRDELFAARLAALLNLTYLRVTYDSRTADAARAQLDEASLGNCVVASGITDRELRGLYSTAFLVCLPTKTHTNPAGITSLTVGMACAAAVAVPAAIAGGYIKDGETGFVISDDVAVFSRRISLLRARIPAIGRAAREYAQQELDNGRVAAGVRMQLAAVDGTSIYGVGRSTECGERI
jgi:hypothetical protein